MWGYVSISLLAVLVVALSVALLIIVRKKKNRGMYYITWHINHRTKFPFPEKKKMFLNKCYKNLIYKFLKNLSLLSDMFYTYIDKLVASQREIRESVG